MRVNPLLADPTQEQATLLGVIYRGREHAGWPSFRHASERSGQMRRVGKPGAWPIFQYVELVLHQQHGLDARSVLMGCPSVPFGGGQGRYGWVDFGKTDVYMLGVEDEVRLTVAGLTRQPRALTEAEVFVDALAQLIDIDGAVTPSPTELQSARLTAAQLRSRLEPPNGRWRLGVAEIDALVAMLEHEPSTWSCQFERGDSAGDWTTTVSPFIRVYKGIRQPEEYVEQLVQRLAPHVAVPQPLHPSSLSLPEAIDYLNAVWRVHADEPLTRIVQ